MSELIAVRVKVKCHKCGYEWLSKSKFVKVSCPSCGAKTLRIKPIEEIPEDQEGVKFEDRNTEKNNKK